MKGLVQQAGGEVRQARRLGGRLVWKFAVFEDTLPTEFKPDGARRVDGPERSDQHGNQEHRAK